MSRFALSPEEEQKLLAVIGVQSAEDLYASIPPRIREACSFVAPWAEGLAERGMSEPEVARWLAQLVARDSQAALRFVGAGSYGDPLPSVLSTLARHVAYLDAGSGAAPERKQGLLQAIFELQTHTKRLCDSEVAAVCFADAGAATAEAILAAARPTPGEPKPVLVARSLMPAVAAKARCLVDGSLPVCESVGWSDDGTVDLVELQRLAERLSAGAFVVGYPNFFGVLEPIEAIRQSLPDSCRLIAVTTDPLALALFEPPSARGADITCGDWRALTATRSGQAGFVAGPRALVELAAPWLVEELSGAEPARYACAAGVSSEHTNPFSPSRAAVEASLAVSHLGGAGLQALARNAHSAFAFLCQELAGVGIPLRFARASHFREAVFEVPNRDARFSKALAAGIAAGIPLADGGARTDFSSSLLVCCHAGHRRDDLLRLVERLARG